MAKSSVNEFFYSLGSGDWSNFLSGIGETISKAEDLYKALDQLGNTRMSYDYFSSKYDENIETARTKATDTSLSKEERATGFEEWQTALDEKNKAAGVLQERIVDGLNKSLVNGTKLNAKDVSFADFENIVAIDLLGV